MTRVVVVACLISGLASAEPAKLRKAEVRDALKTIVPALEPCYARARVDDPQISGVINTKLRIHNEPGATMIMAVEGFDTSGTLGLSRDFLACVKKTIERKKFRPTPTRGTLSLTYPATFGTLPVDNRDRAIVDIAERRIKERRWVAALADAERGLESVTLDGTYRRRLIEVAGVAACHLENEEMARFYYSLASPEVEDRVKRACSKIEL